MNETNVSNENDFKVVTVVNKTDFAFTPELGSMYDSRPIFGKSGTSIEVNEEVILPYHVGMIIAKNLAKAVMNKDIKEDAKGIPTGVAAWDDVKLKNLQMSFIKDEFMEEKPVAQSETDKLMAKVEEYKQMVDKLVGDKNETNDSKYQDKADVIAELEKRNIPHDKRKSKDELEKLLV